MKIENCHVGDVVKICPPMKWSSGVCSHYGMIERIEPPFVYVSVRTGNPNTEMVIQCVAAELSPDRRGR